MTVEPDSIPEERPDAPKDTLGCLGVMLFFSAVGGGLLLCGLSVAIGWGGSYALARVCGFHQVGSIVAGAATALVAAVLSVPLGTLVGAVLELKLRGGTGVDAVKRSMVLAATILPLAMFLQPQFYLPAWLLAPALSGWFYYSQPASTAALWTGLVAPAIGVATGLFMVLVAAGDDSNYSN